MICNHHIGIRPSLAVGVGVGVRVGVGLPPLPESTGGGSSEAVEELFGLPENVPALVIGSDMEVYRTLQDIVPSMDLNLSAQQAREFTRQTQALVGKDMEVYRTLQDIVPSMDLNLSAQQAREFTRQTQALVGKDTSVGESVEQGNGSSIEQFFGVVEPKDCQWMTTDEVCQALEQIMQSLDPELTAQQAQTITTQSQQYENL